MIKPFTDWLIYQVFSLKPDSHLGEAVNFFVYDTIKIFILLALIIFTVSFFRTFLLPEKIKAILIQKRGYLGNFLAAMLGIITPFCTCSVIPLFLGFLQAGVPLGVAFSFLVASPMVNEVAIVLLFGLFGLKITLIYILSGVLIAFFSGIIIGRLKVENLVEQFALGGGGQIGIVSMKFRERLNYAKNYVVDIFKKVWLYIILGIAAGGFMHGYVPAEVVAQYAGGDKWYSVLVAVLIGIPLYSNAAGVIPLVSVLTEKGVSLGTALAFMMAVSGLSLPEFMILKRIMKTKLILIFAAIVGAGILFTGYLFNFLLG